MDKLSDERLVFNAILPITEMSTLADMELVMASAELLALRAENAKLNTSLLEMAGAEAALECDGAKAVAGLLDDAKAENAKLRAVVDAARACFMGTVREGEPPSETWRMPGFMEFEALSKALAALDSEG